MGVLKHIALTGVADCPGAADEVCPLGCGNPANKPILSTKNGDKIVGGIEVQYHQASTVFIWVSLLKRNASFAGETPFLAMAGLPGWLWRIHCKAHAN